MKHPKSSNTFESYFKNNNRCIEVQACDVRLFVKKNNNEIKNLNKGNGNQRDNEEVKELKQIETSLDVCVVIECNNANLTTAL